MKRKPALGAEEPITSQHTQSQESSLCTAAQTGDHVRLVELLDSGVPAETVETTSGWTPILHALHAKQVDCVMTLYQRGARIDRLVGTRKRSYLHIAAELNIPQLVGYFIVNGLSWEAYDLTGKLPIHYAASALAFETIDYFHQLIKPSLTSLTKQGETVLHMAAAAGHEGMVNHLLKLGLDPHAVDLVGAKAIHHSAGAGTLDAFNALLKVMGDESCKDKDFSGRTVAHWAALKGQFNIIIRLLKTKNFMFSVDKKGRSVMHDAAESGVVRVIELLNVNYVSYLEKDHLGRQPIHVAAMAGHEKVVKHFVTFGGVRYDCPDNTGLTPMHLATEVGCETMVLFLKEKGVSLLIEDNDGRIPLHCAASVGNQTLFDKLIALGGGVATHRDKKGRDCLFQAARANQAAFILHLQRGPYGIDFKAVCDLGYSVTHHAAFKGAKEAIVALKTCGASLDEPDKNGVRPVHIVCKLGDCDTFDVLVLNGAEKNATDDRQYNPMCFAAGNGQLVMMKHLVKCGVQYQNIVTSTGLTLLHIAAGFGSLSCVQYLVEELDLDPCCTTTDDKKLSVRAYALSKGKKDVAAYIKSKSPKRNVGFRGPGSIVEINFFKPAQESPPPLQEPQESQEPLIKKAKTDEKEEDKVDGQDSALKK